MSEPTPSRAHDLPHEPDPTTTLDDVPAAAGGGDADVPAQGEGEGDSY